jgi:hypothetical protein
MKRLLALAVCGLVLAPTTGAFGWGSTNTVGDLATRFNTHLCLDKTAYAYLQKDRAFKGADFPSMAAIEAHEGANLLQHGAGPDAKGSSLYSDHWYNPRAARGREGRANIAAAEYFLPLAYHKSGREQGASAHFVAGREQGAAWSAHFLADVHVPYHINGEFASDLRKQLAASPKRLILDQSVTGAPAPLGPLVKRYTGDFTAEANRFVAAARSDSKLDWFDPWFWDGATGYATSDHVLWEGTQAPECPSSPVTHYSEFWPGNPQTQFGDPTEALNAAVGAFVVAMARDTAAHIEDRLNNPRAGEALASQSIATLWRASFSALRTDAVVTFDPATLTDPSLVPVADLNGKLSNVTSEAAGSVQMRVRVITGDCRLIRAAGTPEVQTKGTMPRGVVAFGHWKVQVPRPGTCRLSVEAIGRYAKTPDLQLAWRNLYVSAPGVSAPSGDCKCRAGDTMCLTLCHHNAGPPPTSIQSPTPTRKHCTTRNCIEPVDEE